MWMITAFIVYSSFFVGVLALKLTELMVPSHADLGSTVRLGCLFDLGQGKLYSVKWYKDEFEFYRYMPDNSPQTQVFPLPGIHIDESQSSMNSVTLTQVTYRSSGSYRCEVSTEAPNFETVFRNGNMTVLGVFTEFADPKRFWLVAIFNGGVWVVAHDTTVLGATRQLKMTISGNLFGSTNLGQETTDHAYPDGEPQINGLMSAYSVGDYITANCTSARSNPPPRLSWFINGIKAESWLLDKYPITEHVGPLYSRSLGLRFQAEKRHFQGPGGTLVLKCAVAVDDLPSQAVIANPRIASATSNQKLAQERLSNTGVSQEAYLGVHLVVDMLSLVIAVSWCS